MATNNQEAFSAKHDTVITLMAMVQPLNVQKWFL